MKFKLEKDFERAFRKKLKAVHKNNIYIFPKITARNGEHIPDVVCVLKGQCFVFELKRTYGDIFRKDGEFKKRAGDQVRQMKIMWDTGKVSWQILSQEMHWEDTIRTLGQVVRI